MARDTDAGEARGWALPLAVAIVRPLVAVTKPCGTGGEKLPVLGRLVAVAGRTGAARIALAAGAPVVPVAQWRAQRVLYPCTRRPTLIPRQVAEAKAGDPVYLDDLRGVPPTPGPLREATERIMAAITVLLEGLRGEQAPAGRYEWSREPLRGPGQRRAG